MKLMKFALTALSVTLAAGAAQAATSGTLNLRGIVNVTYDITVTEDVGGANLNLDILAGESNKVVASVNEKSNNPAGYKVTATSANAGLLKNGSVDQVAYTIKYGSSSALSLTASPQTVYTSPALSTPANNTQSISVSFTGKPTALAGTYSDTVTLAIAAP